MQDAGYDGISVTHRACCSHASCVLAPPPQQWHHASISQSPVHNQDPGGPERSSQLPGIAQQVWCILRIHQGVGCHLRSQSCFFPLLSLSVSPLFDFLPVNSFFFLISDGQ